MSTIKAICPIQYKMLRDIKSCEIIDIFLKYTHIFLSLIQTDKCKWCHYPLFLP